jgi:chromosome segregation ATPase
MSETVSPSQVEELNAALTQLGRRLQEEGHQRAELEARLQAEQHVTKEATQKLDAEQAVVQRLREGVSLLSSIPLSVVVRCP